MAAKKSVDRQNKNRPETARPTTNRRAKHGADTTAAAKRSATTAKVASKLAATSSDAGVGEDLVAKSTAGIKAVSRDQYPRNTAHRKGHDEDQVVKFLAHNYSTRANVRANGSGILALAAWAKRLEEEGKKAARDADDGVTTFIRGLIHR
jgi:hypothetical protein